MNEKMLKPMSTPVIRMPSLINRSAVKSFALEFCKAQRPKFTRISSEFLDDVEARLDSRIRQLSLNVPEDASWLGIKLKTNLATTFAARKAQQRLNLAAKGIIIGKIRAHPSIGVTLK